MADYFEECHSRVGFVIVAVVIVVVGGGRWFIWLVSSVSEVCVVVGDGCSVSSRGNRYVKIAFTHTDDDCGKQSSLPPPPPDGVFETTVPRLLPNSLTAQQTLAFNKSYHCTLFTLPLSSFTGNDSRNRFCMLVPRDFSFFHWTMRCSSSSRTMPPFLFFLLFRKFANPSSSNLQEPFQTRRRAETTRAVSSTVPSGSNRPPFSVNCPRCVASTRRSRSLDSSSCCVGSDRFAPLFGVEESNRPLLVLVSVSRVVVTLGEERNCEKSAQGE